MSLPCLSGTQFRNRLLSKTGEVIREQTEQTWISNGTGVNMLRTSQTEVVLYIQSHVRKDLQERFTVETRNGQSVERLRKM
jgi:hypothetical protein